MIAIVELAEQDGLRFTTDIVHCPVQDVAIGLPVRVVFEQQGDVFVRSSSPIPTRGREPVTQEQRARGLSSRASGPSRIGRKTGMRSPRAHGGIVARGHGRRRPHAVGHRRHRHHRRHAAAVAAETLGVSPTWTGGSLGYYGLLTPVVDACTAVARGAARHVLVYRTVNMIGGEARVERSAGPDGIPPAMRDITRILTMHAYSASNWLAMHLRRHMHLYGTTGSRSAGWPSTAGATRRSIRTRSIGSPSPWRTTSRPASSPSPSGSWTATCPSTAPSPSSCRAPNMPTPARTRCASTPSGAPMAPAGGSTPRLPEDGVDRRST